MKKFINKILDVPKLIRRIWILLWLLLAMLLVMKFCFNMWYPIIINNETFNNVCNFIDNNKIVSYMIMFPFYYLATSLSYFISSVKRFYGSKKELVIISVLIICSFVTKAFLTYAGLLFEVLLLIIIPIFNLIKKYPAKRKIILILIPFLVQCILFLWQLSIYLVRGLDVETLDKYPSLIYLAMQLDYYTFIIITFIGGSFMGLLGPWLWGGDVTVLKAEKEKELAKEKPDMDKIAEIDKRISELEAE